MHNTFNNIESMNSIMDLKKSNFNNIQINNSQDKLQIFTLSQPKNGQATDNKNNNYLKKTEKGLKLLQKIVENRKFDSPFQTNNFE